MHYQTREDSDGRDRRGLERAIWQIAKRLRRGESARDFLDREGAQGHRQKDGCRSVESDGEVTAMEQHLDWRKFKALVHYICDKASDPSVLGAVKLNKVLWYSDSIHYMIEGESITGETYVKRQHGPVPRHILRAVDELVREGKIARGRVDHFGFTKNEYIAIRESDVSSFSAEQIKLVDAAFEHVCLNHTARSVSEETHGAIWQIAAMGEEIPLATVFASDVGEVDEDDLAWARSRLSPAADVV